MNLSDRLNLFLICHGRDCNCICDICGNNVCHADEFDLVMTVAVLGIVADSIDDNCDGDTSGNIVCCVDCYGGVMTRLYTCAVCCMNICPYSYT